MIVIRRVASILAASDPCFAPRETTNISTSPGSHFANYILYIGYLADYLKADFHPFLVYIYLGV